jgi:putative transposase
LIASIESINFQPRKHHQNRCHFRDKEAAMKLLYLGLRIISSESGGYPGTGTHDRECGIEHTRPTLPGTNRIVSEYNS